MNSEWGLELGSEHIVVSKISLLVIQASELNLIMLVSHHLAMNNWVAIKTHPETNPWTLGAKLGASARLSFTPLPHRIYDKGASTPF